MTRDRDGFFAHLTGGRSVLTVALPSEIAVMRKHFGLEVELVDQVEGFVLTKGKSQTLQIAVVSRGEDAGGGDAARPAHSPGGAEGDARKVSEARASSSRDGTGRRTGDGLPGPSPHGPPGRRPARGSPAREPVQVAGRQQDAGLGKDDLAGAVDVVADHGASHQERLGKHPGEPLAKTRVNHGIDRAQKLGNAVGRHQAGEDERLANAEPLEVGDQPLAQNSVADPDELDARVGGEDLGARWRSGRRGP